MTCNYLEQRGILLVKITDLLSTRDYSIKELCDETGGSNTTVWRVVRLGVKSGRFVCIAKTKRLFSSGMPNGVLAARYVLAEGREQKAETLIYRLLDKLIEHQLDEHEIALVRESQQFIGVEIFRGES